MSSVPKRYFDELEGLFEGFLPFTPLSIVSLSLGKNTASLLDVGSGKGYPARFLGRWRRLRVVCCDLFEPYLRHSKKINADAEGHALCDARALPFRERSFDTVLCMRVLEHLRKSDGKELILDLERIAREQVVIFTPARSYPQEAYEGNPCQRHMAIWNPSELECLGYKVIGNGLPFLWGSDTGMGVRFPVLRPLLMLLWILSAPFVYRAPDLAANMVCVKNVRERKLLVCEA
jgi:SAM-dependent methyltransferase